MGDFQEYEDLGEMEPLRVMTADGREWGKGLAEVPMERGQTAVGLGSLSEEPSMVNLEGKGYNTWEDSCLIKFSEFLGVTTAVLKRRFWSCCEKWMFGSMEIKGRGTMQRQDVRGS